MKEYKFDDFSIGNSVYHRSNNNIKMIVISTDPETNEIECRWMDKNGSKNESNYLFVELIKVDDYNRKYRSIRHTSL